MNRQSPTDPLNASWELFADLEMPLSADQNESIHAWLDRTLQPLKLYEDICHRVEMSLQEAATRALNAQSENGNRHIHVNIYILAERPLKGNNWSFFRVEKIQDQAHDGKVPDHAIELYLYLETH